jgi:7-cyano-7-deazaguanine synthase in queuosine biosynthesis
MKRQVSGQDLIPSVTIDVCEAGVRARSADHICRIGRDLIINLERLSRYCLVDLQPLEDDLLLVAGAVAFADRVVARRSSIAWRRNLHVAIPVNEPDRWKERTLYRNLISTLDYVTGDNWEFSFKHRETGTKVKPQASLAMPNEASLVMPFSDGLDSFAVARLINAEHPNTPLILVTTGNHKNRALDLSNCEFSRLLYRVAIPFTLSSRHRNVRFREPSYRSRAFVFGIVAGIAAHQLGANQIYVAESGQGSLGPWLTPVGNEAPDVRMHPSFTSRLSSFLNHVFGSSLCHVHPRLWQTKGETLRELKQLGLTDQWWLTSSCARDQRYVFLDNQKIQCGVCAGCLLRRQSVLAAELSSDSDRYLWSDLRTSKLREALTSRETTQNDEHQALCAALEMQQFGQIACDSEKIYIAAQELSPFVNQDTNAVVGQLQRLITAHAAEWGMFRSSIGHQSFINQWLDILT